MPCNSFDVSAVTVKHRYALKITIFVHCMRKQAMANVKKKDLPFLKKNVMTYGPISI